MNIEEKRDKLNLELKVILSILNLIDGEKKEYPNYNPSDNLSESEFLDQQLFLATDAKNRLLSVFKD